jgi:hypothetical protein
MGIMQRTKRGGDPFEVISALQKSIRRGQEELALCYALELVESSTQYCSMCLNRLLVILHEDIGIAEPLVMITVQLNVQTAREFQKAGKIDEVPNVLANTIMLMCRARKTRIGGHLEAVCRERLNKEGLPPIPDVALDMHTRAGRALGRGLQHFLEEGQTLMPEADELAHTDSMTDPYYARAVAIWQKHYPDKGAKIPEDGDEQTLVEPPPKTTGRKQPRQDANQGALFASHHRDVSVKE